MTREVLVEAGEGVPVMVVSFRNSVEAVPLHTLLYTLLQVHRVDCGMEQAFADRVEWYSYHYFYSLRYVYCSR